MKERKEGVGEMGRRRKIAHIVQYLPSCSWGEWGISSHAAWVAKPWPLYNGGRAIWVYHNGGRASPPPLPTQFNHLITKQQL